MPLFTEPELQLFRQLPEGDVVDLAAELDIAVPESIELAALMGRALHALLDRARTEGLPLSDYDRDDLAALSGAELAALGQALGAAPSVDALLKRGHKVYKMYRRKRSRSQVPLMVPLLLGPLARLAAIEGSSR